MSRIVTGRPGRVPYYLANLPSVEERAAWGVESAAEQRLDQHHQGIAEQMRMLRESGRPDLAELLDPGKLYSHVYDEPLPVDFGAAAEILFCIDSRVLTRRQWLTIFRRSAKPPERQQRVTLYRGSAYRHRYGLAWTDSLELAANYAVRHRGAGIPRVWVASVGPERIFQIHPDRTVGGEWLIDPAGLPITEYDGPALVWSQTLGRWTADLPGDAARQRKLRDVHAAATALRSLRASAAAAPPRT